MSTFLEVARTGSVVSASAELGVTQPAVSKTLKELESIVGVPLFDRRNRRLFLNASGVIFQRLGAAALNELDRAQTSARAAHRNISKLSVGALPTTATTLVPTAALDLQRLMPSCVLRVSTGPNWFLLSQLRAGALDIVVGRMADPDSMTGLTFQQLHAENVVAVVRHDHPLTCRPDSEAFLSYPLILPPSGAVIHQLVRSYLVSVGASDARPIFESVSLAFSRHILLESDAIWFISKGVIREELHNGLLRALDLDAPMLAGPVGISRRADEAASPEAEALIAALQNASKCG
ncbi:LysR family transcriptional regulator [Roseobacter insulae]|uniref:LysR family transcriptional regulator n=1 Tax=Roseobacter insulae TaxID=2859783 RepID=UPI0021509077|nr:LysR family transcriptional regulator [Roseobacter insulae]